MTFIFLKLFFVFTLTLYIVFSLIFVMCLRFSRYMFKNPFLYYLYFFFFLLLVFTFASFFGFNVDMFLPVYLFSSSLFFEYMFVFEFFFNML